MVIELLTFEIRPHVRNAWLDADEKVWTAFLETCDGFVRKEVWIVPDRPDEVTVAIWWRSMAQWKSIDSEAVARVDARMGDLAVEPTCRSFEVARGD